MVDLAVGTAVVATWHYVEHTVVLAILERSVDTEVVSVCHEALANLLLVNLGSVRKLRNRRMTLVLLLKLVYLVIDLVERTDLIEWQTYDTALLCDGLQYALANPPYSIRDEFESARLIKLLCSFNEADITFVNEVGQCQTLMLVLFCYGYYKSQVGCDKFVFSTLTFRTTFLDLLCQFNFLIDGNKRGASNLNEVFIKCFTRTVCNTF